MQDQQSQSLGRWKVETEKEKKKKETEKGRHHAADQAICRIVLSPAARPWSCRFTTQLSWNMDHFHPS